MLKNKLFVCFFILICGGFFFAHNSSAQSIDSASLLKILSNNDSTRKMLSYHGIVEIDRDYKEPKKIRLSTWMQGTEFYYYDILYPLPPKNKKDEEYDKRNSFRIEHYEYSWMPDKEYIELLLNNYHVSFEPSEAVAGRSTNLLSIIPIHLPRFGMKVWMDKEKNLILKREIIYFRPDEEVVILRLQFKEIQYDVSLPDSVQKDQKRHGHHHDRSENEIRKKFSSLQELKNSETTPVYVPGYVPKGCELVSIRYTKEKYRTVDHLHYTDGLLNFSIFQFNGKTPRFIKRLLKRNDLEDQSFHDFRQIYALQIGDTAFFFVGNFPVFQLKQIAQSLKKF